MAKGEATQPRKLVSTKRISGTILDWRGNFGWIQAGQPIDHPDAHRTGGKIYLSAEDVQEELTGIGAAVTFFVYLDDNGLGAMNVRPATQKASEAPETANASDSGKGSSAKGKEKGGGSHGGHFRGGYRAAGKAPARSQETVLERLHEAVYNSAWTATKSVVRLQRDWDHNEFAKRITKYIYKAAQAPELMALPPQQAAQQFIESGMHGFSSACGDKSWFFELDLAPTFCDGFYEIFASSGHSAAWSEVESCINAKYEELMDACLLEKAIWDSAALLLPDESLRNKLYKALKSGHENAFKQAAEETQSMPDLQRVEAFTSLWIEHSMSKAWSALETGGNLMTPSNLVYLFQDLVAPFGEDHPFSCVPAVLTQSIGRPPRDWPFLKDAVRQFLKTWNQPAAKGRPGGRAQKRPFAAFGKGDHLSHEGNWGPKRSRSVKQEEEAEAELFDPEEDPVAQALLDQVAAAEGEVAEQ